MTTRTRALLPCAAALLALAATGCARTPLSISVGASAVTNDGRPFYMLVRTVDAKAFSKESYQDVARRVMEPDDSVLRSEVVFPGIDTAVEVSPPAKSPVAIYFFFTAPGQPWQRLFDSPLPRKVRAVLDWNRVDVVEIVPAPGSLTAPKLAAPKLEAPKVEAPKVEAPKAPGG